MYYLIEWAKNNKNFIIKTTIVSIIAAGWFYAAWHGGVMGLWACFCAGVAGYCSSTFTQKGD